MCVNAAAPFIVSHGDLVSPQHFGIVVVYLYRHRVAEILLQNFYETRFALEVVKCPLKFIHTVFSTCLHARMLFQFRVLSRYAATTTDDIGGERGGEATATFSSLNISSPREFGFN